MPAYRFHVETDQGFMVYRGDVRDEEKLGNALTHIIAEIKRDGYIVAGGSKDSLAVYFQGRELDRDRTLLEQGVEPNEKLDVRVKTQPRPPRPPRPPAPRPVVDLKRKVYFMALVGGMAGLLCWCAVVWIPEAFTLPQESYWKVDVVMLVLLGGLIGGLTVGFADHWLHGQVVFRFVLLGVLTGLLAGSLSGLVLTEVNQLLRESSPAFSQILSWLLAFALMGFATGLRWVNSNRNRALHALIGGLCGGALGGIVFAFQFGGDPDLSKALSLMLAGAGITCGVTVAPVILRSGILRLVNSGSADVRNQQRNREWELIEGDQYVIGKLKPGHSMGSLRSDIDVLILDDMMAERHAYIRSHRRRFYIEPHNENMNSDGLPVSPLQLRGRDIVEPAEIRDGDVITVGQTLLQYEARRQR